MVSFQSKESIPSKDKPFTASEKKQRLNSTLPVIASSRTEYPDQTADYGKSFIQVSRKVEAKFKQKIVMLEQKVNQLSGFI